jgi:hypothetical protein
VTKGFADKSTTNVLEEMMVFNSGVSMGGGMGGDMGGGMIGGGGCNRLIRCILLRFSSTNGGGGGGVALTCLSLTGIYTIISVPLLNPKLDFSLNNFLNIFFAEILAFFLIFGLHENLNNK